MLGSYIIFVVASIILLGFVLLYFLKKDFITKRQKPVLYFELVLLTVSVIYMFYYIFQHVLS